MECWVDKAEAFEEIHSNLIVKIFILTSPTVPVVCDSRAFWLNKYADLVARFEGIALNSEAAKQYVLN